MPSIVDLVAVGAGPLSLVQADEVSERVDATYFDTLDRRLARAGLTLCRRTGGDAARWQVEIPGTDGGVPFLLPAGRSAVTVPAPIRRLVWASTRGAGLRPMARIVTERTTHRLIDADKSVIVEIADESARGELLGADTAADSVTARWRILQVGAAVREWQDVVDAGLRGVGARASDIRRELEFISHGAGGGRRTADTTGGGKATRPSPTSPAGEVVLRYVDQQLEQIVASDPLVRIDIPGSVHHLRVATRRLRSSLQTFEPVLSSEAVTPLRSELKWLAGVLGAARDAEVLRDRMLTAMPENDRTALPGSLENTIDSEMAQAYRLAHDGLLRALNSGRYHRLVISLFELVSDPPFTAEADRPAGRVLPRQAARAYRRLHARVTSSHRASTPAERDSRLHEARKAAKKARYAGETMTEFFGKPAARFALAMEKLQEELGEHQDSVVMRARVEELARRETSTAAIFAYGRVHAHEEQRGQLAVERFEAAWRKSKKKALRAWLG